ncbi:dodecenoyl-CoA isomerase, partial [Cladochytrium tenue]
MHSTYLCLRPVPIAVGLRRLVSASSRHFAIHFSSTARTSNGRNGAVEKAGGLTLAAAAAAAAAAVAKRAGAVRGRRRHSVVTAAKEIMFAVGSVLRRHTTRATTTATVFAHLPSLRRTNDLSLVAATPAQACLFSSSQSASAHPGVHVDLDDDHIAHMRLTAPPVNALTPDLLRSIRTAVTGLPALGARGMILTSNSKKVFSAGLDLKLLRRGDSEDPTEFFLRTKEYLRELQEAARALLSSDLPTVAVVQGASPAGGTVLALCCDYRIAPDAPEGTPFVMGLNETQ